MGKEYIPALRFGWLTPLYDPLLRRVMREETFKTRLLHQASIRAGERVLDLGCGTGTLTIRMKQRQPGATIVGLDGDPTVLEIARAKADRAGLEIMLDEGLAYDLPYPSGTFDRVLSSLMLHHLNQKDKLRAVQEVFRVLRPHGEFHVLDFGRPHTPYARLIAPVMRRLEPVGDNLDGLLPRMFWDAGFRPVEEPERFGTVFGTLVLYRACKSS